MNYASLQELEQIFKGTRFTLITEKQIPGTIRCYINAGGYTLCCLSGTMSNPQMFHTVDFTGHNYNTGEILGDMQKTCRRMFLELTPADRQKIFDILQLEPLSKIEIDELIIDEARNKVFDKIPLQSPQYASNFKQTYTVYNIYMNEQLILDNEKKSEFVGIYGLQPGIGIAIISKAATKVKRIGLCHFGPLTNLTALEKLVEKTTMNSETVDVVVLAAEKEKVHVRNIIKRIVLNTKCKTNVCVELNDNLKSFAINTMSGTIYKNIPETSFVRAKKHDEKIYAKNSSLRNMMGQNNFLLLSDFYNSDIRKTAINIVNKTLCKKR